MGNSESLEQYWPYICLLQQVLKAGGTKISEDQLLELLQTIEKHCLWFLSLGTFRFRNLGEGIRETSLQGSALACIYLVNLDTEKIYFRNSSDSRKFRGSEDEWESPSEGRPEYPKPAGIEQKTQEALKSTVPSVLLQRMNFLYLHFLPLLS